MRFQAQRNRNLLAGRVARAHSALKPRRADDAVQSFVAQNHCGAVKYGGQNFAVPPALFASHLEDIRKVGFKGDRKLRVHFLHVEVVDRDPLVACCLCEEFCSIDMQRAAADKFTRSGLHVRVHQVDREQHVVFADGGTEQKRRLPTNLQFKPRQMPGLVMEDSLMREGHRVNIPAAVEYRKGIAVEQNSSSIVGQRRARANVELLADLNNVFMILRRRHLK